MTIQETTISFNPPSWIQGTWTSDANFTDFRYKPDDFCYLDGTTEYCHKERIENSNGAIEANETITETTYDIEYSGGGTKNYWSFIKISNTKIVCVNPMAREPNMIFYKINLEFTLLNPNPKILFFNPKPQL
ncbi:hypothetical protein [Winogradskyella sp. SM1960]|uniref:hypothetical protein n=1 Tax=Winogradskyella sp. SM1960 TaxID=2865955 RepID=UPI001CD2C8AD|nr:hypothetical protein [Winogradskyella sp. SM1960]